MKIIPLSVLVAIQLSGAVFADVISPQGARQDADGVTLWYDGTLLPLEGRAFSDTHSYYDRLPARAQAIVPGPVWGLSHDSAGMALRFTTDASSFKVRWAVRKQKLAMPHMPSTGVSGLDVYRRTPQGWRFVRNCRPSGTTNEMQVALHPGSEALIYLPLYNGTAMLEVGLPKEKTLSTAPARPSGNVRPIVFYGTSITQGGCASRPGMAFTAIAGRFVDAPVVNLGFSGNGKMELALCELIAEIEASVYVLDCLWNMNETLIRERAEPFIRALRHKRPQIPILLAEDCNVFERAPTPKAQLLRGIYDKLKAEEPGLWANLHYLEAQEMLGHDSEGTVDGCHPNDLGMMRMGQVYGAALQRVLAK